MITLFYKNNEFYSKSENLIDSLIVVYFLINTIASAFLLKGKISLDI